MRALAIAALASCAGHPLVTYTITAPAATRCEPERELPPLDPAFVPDLEGRVALVDARGDARLSAAAGILTAWSPDSTVVAFFDFDGATLWRASDGALIDRVPCGVGEMGADAIAMSADLRWIAISGVARATETAITCLVDREAHATRTFDGGIVAPRFAGDRLVGDDRAIVLATGEPAAPPAPIPAPGHTIDTGGATGFATSHDGHLLVGWTELRLHPASGRAAPAAPEPAFLAVWDATTGRRLWRDDARCCSEWRFSPDDRFLEPRVAGGAHDILRAQTGERVPLPGYPLPIAPDGSHLIVVEANARPAVWTLDPTQRVVDVARTRAVVARAGGVEAALDGGELVVQRDGDCFALGVRPRSPEDTIALSADGRWLYAGLFGAATSTAYTWNAYAGAAATAIATDGPIRSYPLPGSARIAFATPTGLRLFDAPTGRVTGDVAAPRTSGPAGLLGGGPHPDAFVGPVVATADGRTLVGELSVAGAPASRWNLDDGTVRDLRAPPGRVDAVAVSPDERFVAAGLDDGVVRLWARDGRAIPVDALPTGGALDHLAFSADAGLLAAAERWGGVTLVDTATGEVIGRLHLRSDHATFLAWAGDQLVIDTARGFRITIRRGSA